MIHQPIRSNCCILSWAKRWWLHGRFGSWTRVETRCGLLRCSWLGESLVRGLKVKMVLFIRMFQLLSYCLMQFLFRNPAEPSDYRLYCGVRNVPLCGIYRCCCGEVSSIIP